MVTTCIISGCISVSKKRTENCTAKRSQDITFHRLPKDPQLQAKWVAAISRHRTYYKPIASHCVCSNHFRSSDYEDDGSRRVLNKGSIPTVFEDIPAPKRKEKLSREPLVHHTLSMDCPSPSTSESIPESSVSPSLSSSSDKIIIPTVFKGIPDHLIKKEKPSERPLVDDHPPSPSTLESTSESSTSPSLSSSSDKIIIPTVFKNIPDHLKIMEKPSGNPLVCDYPLSVDSLSPSTSESTPELLESISSSSDKVILRTVFKIIPDHLKKKEKSSGRRPVCHSLLVNSPSPSVSTPASSPSLSLSSSSECIDQTYSTSKLYDKRMKQMRKKLLKVKEKNRQLQQKVRRYVKEKDHLQGIIDELREKRFQIICNDHL